MLPRLKTAEQFAAVMDASKSKDAALAGIWRSEHFVLHLAPHSVLPTQTRPAKQEQVPIPRVSNDVKRETKPTIGVVCPKRFAKRAVTRNAIKRQIYAVTSELAAQLPRACLVLRLSATYSCESFRSASSPALKRALRTELLGLLQRPSFLASA